MTCLRCRLHALASSCCLISRLPSARQQVTLAHVFALSSCMSD
ncbi:hypothetical protein SLEP1_g30645 [Rubroshorea leprosula]|uniref:Uncharacterized protein n=1 Tax=Rubroshorea leprosula TaxID=152421 RepID=A0AAV5K0T4_9ROSI|nr:hypothetical protein SLEP1_g30645 [Rubroshorea leprosula]